MCNSLIVFDCVLLRLHQAPSLDGIWIINFFNIRVEIWLSFFIPNLIYVGFKVLS